MRILKVAAVYGLAALAASCAEDPGAFGGTRPDEMNPPDGPAKTAEAPNLTDAELAALPRDERRTRIVEGFSCNMMLIGQPGRVEYRPGGIGLVSHQEGEVVFNWSIENDELCVRGVEFRDRCSALPRADLPNEREWLTTALGKGCF
ncbi:MAG: hypothetical protein AAGF90_06725 [Pseudomonadota bacterium]